MKAVFLDACFLIALYDTDDPYHDRALQYFRTTLDVQPAPARLIMPWPIMYETASTRMVRRQWHIGAMRTHWRTLDMQRRLIFLDDGPYREAALRECFDESLKAKGSYRALSLADRVIRSMLGDLSVLRQIEAFVTFNQADFVDVCKSIPCVVPRI